MCIGRGNHGSPALTSVSIIAVVSVVIAVVSVSIIAVVSMMAVISDVVRIPCTREVKEVSSNLRTCFCCRCRKTLARTRVGLHSTGGPPWR